MVERGIPAIVRGIGERGLRQAVVEGGATSGSTLCCARRWHVQCTRARRRSHLWPRRAETVRRVRLVSAPSAPKLLQHIGVVPRCGERIAGTFRRPPDDCDAEVLRIRS